MSTDSQLETDTDANDGEATEQSPAELRTQLELLAEENQQLRDSYVRAKQTQYRRTALGLGLVGLLAASADILFPSARNVLFALGGTGLFVAIFTYYPTSERFVSADVGRDVYAALAENQAALVNELGLSETRLYVPTEPGDSPVRLFVPQHGSYTIPDDAALTRSAVVMDSDDTRGVAFTPSGGRLFNAFETARSGPLADTPGEIATQLTDALVKQFELVGSAHRRWTQRNPVSRLPSTSPCTAPSIGLGIPSQQFAVGLAEGLGTPVTLEGTAAADDRASICSPIGGAKPSPMTEAPNPIAVNSYFPDRARVCIWSKSRPSRFSSISLRPESLRGLGWRHGRHGT
jgi:hypothetical protein